MIDELQLHALAESGFGPGIACRPVEAVMARGTRLRRRRQAVRTAGATAGVVALIGVGLSIRAESPTRDPDVRASSDAPAASPGGAAVSPPPVDCASVDTIPGEVVSTTEGSDPASPAAGDAGDAGGVFVGPEPVRPADMPDALRVLPTWTPSTGRITLAQGSRWPMSCTGTPDRPAEDRLIWEVEIGGTRQAVQTGVECLVEASPRDDAAPDIAGGNGQHVTVNGEDALWGPSPLGPAGAMALTWQLGPDAIARAGCLDGDATRTLPLEDIVRMAESMVPVPADDTRIPDDPRLQG